MPAGFLIPRALSPGGRDAALWRAPLAAGMPGTPQTVFQKHMSHGEVSGTFIFTLYFLKASEDGRPLDAFCAAFL